MRLIQAVPSVFDSSSRQATSSIWYCTPADRWPKRKPSMSCIATSRRGVPPTRRAMKKFAGFRGARSRRLGDPELPQCADSKPYNHGRCVPSKRESRMDHCICQDMWPHPRCSAKQPLLRASTWY